MPQRLAEESNVGNTVSSGSVPSTAVEHKARRLIYEPVVGTRLSSFSKRGSDRKFSR